MRESNGSAAGRILLGEGLGEGADYFDISKGVLAGGTAKQDANIRDVGRAVLHVTAIRGVADGEGAAISGF